MSKTLILAMVRTDMAIYRLYDTLRSAGVRIRDLDISYSLDAIIDWMGVASDNTLEVPQGPDVFCRDWLTDWYFEVLRGDRTLDSWLEELERESCLVEYEEGGE